MYDEFENERQLVRLPQFNFTSNRYEIWSGGKMVSSAKTTTVLSFIGMKDDTPKMNNIEVFVLSTLSDDIIDSKLNFDVAYTNNDRILLAVIPQNSNCKGDNGFDSFVKFAPFYTRDTKNFKANEPHACSLFFVNGNPNKITFSIAASKLLIEFYS